METVPRNIGLTYDSTSALHSVPHSRKKQRKSYVSPTWQSKSFTDSQHLGVLGFLEYGGSAEII